MRKQDRELIYKKYQGRCAYCGCELPDRWHVDHIKPVVRNPRSGIPELPERDNYDNYNPSCPSCNIVKGSITLEQFREHISYFITSLNLYSTQYKFAKKYGLVQETGNPVVFYFETINQKTDTILTGKEAKKAYEKATKYNNRDLLKGIVEYCDLGGGVYVAFSTLNGNLITQVCDTFEQAMEYLSE